MYNSEQIYGCHIDYCVTMCNEKALNPLQTWLTGFSAMYHYTTFGTASAAKLATHAILILKALRYGGSL